MSGVNCRRRNSMPSARAVALASSVLATPGHALEQHVAAERERGEHVLQRLVVADDDLADLARDAGVQLLHDDRSLLWFGAHERGGERVDVLHPRRRRRRCRGPRAGRSGGPAAQTATSAVSASPSSVHFTLRRQAAEAARDAVAVHGLQERDRASRRRPARARARRCRPRRAPRSAAARRRRAARRCPRRCAR